MEYYSNGDMATLLEGSLSSVNIVAAPGTPKGVAFVNADNNGGCKDGHAVDWLTITDQSASIKEDVAKIANHPLVGKGIPLHGYLYDVKTGSIIHVVSTVTRS
jgi:carbonic anhydrase